MRNSQSFSYKFNTIFCSLIFHISLPRLGYFSYKKGNLIKKFSHSKCDGERDQRNAHFRNTSNSIQNLWEKNTEVLVISKGLKFPWDDRKGIQIL